MNKVNFYHIIFFIICLIACNNDKNESEKSEYPYFIVEPIKDTVRVEEYSKFYLLLGKSVFHGKNSSAQVAIDMSENDTVHLKKDLSNIDSIPFRLFQNLELDTVNKRYIGGDTLDNKSVIFGKKFDKKGNFKIRGVLLEYYGDYNPLTLKFEGKVGDTAKTYFEVNVHVKDSIN